MKMKKIAMKKKIKYKFKFRKNLKKKFESKSLKKLFQLLCLIAIYIYLCINNDYKEENVIVKDSIFREIVSFENNLDLSKQNFSEFCHINSANKLIEENQKFKKLEIQMYP